MISPYTNCMCMMVQHGKRPGKNTIMKKIFTILTLFICFTAGATNYYFSTALGDDARSSSLAQSPATPWKTLSKLTSSFTTFVPGDSILLKRGETFYGSITANFSGTASLPIVIGAWGTG